MTDLELIQLIEKTFGYKLKKVEQENIDHKYFYTINPFYLNLSDIQDPRNSYKGARHYCLDKEGNVTGLSLDYTHCFLLQDNLLCKLKHITFLSLRSSGISDASFLKEFKGLTNLDLSCNENIKDYSFLKDIKGLKTLYLSANNLSDVSFLKDIKGLKILYLSRNNNIKDYSFLRELKVLTTLNLRDNNLSDVSFLNELKGLTTLDLSHNNLSDVSFLNELKGLTTLDSSWNKNIKDYSFLKELSGLTTLDLSSNDLSDVSFLKELKGLTSLYLSSNDLSDVSFLNELKGLTTLDLSSNNLSDVSFLNELKGLTILYLSANNLSDISFLKELKGLTAFYLSQNNLRDYSFIKELNGLITLDLSHNNLSDVSFLKELKGLITVNLSNNKINAFKPWLAEKGLAIRADKENEYSCINLTNNSLESPPLEVVKQGNTAIKKYFKDIEEEGKDYIYEAKLLILGEPGAGKTSLARKLKDIDADLPMEEETTRGIDVDTWQFPYTIHNQKEKEITANIWDFGGQAIYKATHRFFLSHRSLYAIVADARKEDTDFYYWLHTVEIFGEESPAIIVINEKEDRQRDLPYQSLRTRFKILEDKKEVNFKEPDHRLTSLIDKLKYEISHLKHIGDPIPANWKKIRDDIAKEEKADKVITLKAYRKICEKHNLLKYKDQDIVCEFFHDLGVFLHFKDDDVLNHYIFLDKEWILEGAYRIIDDKGLAEKKGRFTREDIEKIFSDEYADYIREIIALMKKFYLVYEKDSFIIAPQMLPYDAPEYEWESKENIQFRFVYDIFMPAGILWQFIVEMKDEIKENLVWRYGVVLDFGDTQAEVIEANEDNLVQIKVSGKRREDIRAVIIRKIEEINRQFKKLKAKKLVPCVCAQCKDSEAPYLFDYQTLINARNAHTQVTYLPCLISFKNVEIIKLLSGIEFLEKEKPLSEKEKGIKNIKIFLASSEELKEDRREFEFFINRQNKNLIKKENIFLELEIWEDFIDSMSQTRLQDEYNNAVRNCDIFVMLFFTKVGEFTLEEFETAFGQFKERNRPLIYTYFKNAPINTGDLNEQNTQSLFAFQKRLKELGHYKTEYENIDDLKNKFGEQLKKILPGF